MYVHSNSEVELDGALTFVPEEGCKPRFESLPGMQEPDTAACMLPQPSFWEPFDMPKFSTV
jgi:hypothetical protein